MPPNAISCVYPTGTDTNHPEGALTAMSRHPGVVNVLMCDGSSTRGEELDREYGLVGAWHQSRRGGHQRRQLLTRARCAFAASPAEVHLAGAWRALAEQPRPRDGTPA